MSKPARPPPPPVSFKANKKVLPSPPPSLGDTPPLLNNKPSVKPKPTKLHTSSPVVSKKPTLTASLSTDQLLGDSIERSPRASPVSKKKLVSVVSNDVNAEIMRQLESSNKHKPGNKSPTELGNRSITKSPVLPPKPLSRKSSPRSIRHTQVSPAPISDKPKKIIVQQLSVSSGPSVIPVNDNNDTYEAPDVQSVRVRSLTDPNVFEHSFHNVTYEAPDMVHPKTSDDTPNTNDKSFIDSSDTYAYLSDTFETPSTKGTTDCTSPDGGCGKYEVPIKTVDTTIGDDDTYETPDIESIRMIQAELKNKSNEGNGQDTITSISPPSSANMIPPPPGMLPSKLQQRKVKNKKLPAIPTVSLDSFRKSNKPRAPNSNSVSKDDSSSGYTKVKNRTPPPLPQNGGDGMIYEEVKANNTTPTKKPIDTTHSITAPPRLPPPRKPPHLPQHQSLSNIPKASSQPDVISNGNNGGLELTEDDEGQDYMDMSGSSLQDDTTTSTTSLRQQSSLPVKADNSEDIYEAMDVSRPIPPPRRRHRHTEIQANKGQVARNKLKPSKSLDGLLATNNNEDNNYVTMHRPTPIK